MALAGGEAALFTDFYELTMAASYHRRGLDHQATFDLFVRALPPARSFLVACGLEDALGYLEGWRFDQEALDYLSSQPRFSDDFLAYLGDLRFGGEVWAVPEGEVVFAGEPLLRVTAPLIQAQIVETALINLVASQTMMASKAARVALACGDRPFVDFSARRDHGPDAALAAARAAFLAGAAGTSLVAAGRRYGLPLSGTMAHAYVMTFAEELDAFRAFLRDFPDDAVLLIDTYDTEEGARQAVRAAQELAGEGVTLRGLRLDSGDLDRLARSVRRILDQGGLGSVHVLASGDLDEYRITELIAAGAPVDAFGVGTQLGTSADAPYLGGVYKLVEDVSGPKIKLSQGKVTLPGRKQVHRVRVDGRSDHDVIALHDEPVPDGVPLLEQVMVDGRPVAPRPDLAAARERCQAAVAALPPRLRSLQQREMPYEVRTSDALAELVRRLTVAHAVPPPGA